MAVAGFIEWQTILNGGSEAEPTAPAVSSQPFSLPLFDALFGGGS